MIFTFGLSDGRLFTFVELKVNNRPSDRSIINNNGHFEPYKLPI